VGPYSQKLLAKKEESVVEILQESAKDNKGASS